MIGVLFATAVLAFLSFQRSENISPSLKALRELRSDIRWDDHSVVAADFDGDGRRDQAVLGRGRNYVFVGIVYSFCRKPEILEFAVSGVCRPRFAANLRS